MNRLLTVATAEYEKAAIRLCASATPWFDETRIVRPKDFPREFYQRHARLFEWRRGHGYWIQKPAGILREVESLAPDDVLMYCDSQVGFIADPAPLFKLAAGNGGVALFHQRREGHKNSTWTRGDTFRLMGCDAPEYWNGDNLNSAFSLWMNTPKAVAFLKEWLAWNSNYQVVSDEPSVTPNAPDFKAHRHDQSIISLLAIKHGVKTFTDPSQYGLGYAQPGCDYPQIIAHHRAVKPPWHNRPTMSSIVEVSTVGSCSLRCSYCPQGKLDAAYDGPQRLAVDMFNRCLDNMVPGDAIHFSGFVEPCLNPNIVELLDMALARGHRIKVYTTGRGLTVAKAERIAAMELDLLMLHMPDDAGHLSHSDNNVPVLDALATHPNARCMAMGNIPHASVAHLWGRVPVQYGPLHDRAGNVDTMPVEHRRHKGPIKCGAAPALDHPVLLPSGLLACCCCDYSLSQIVGDLSTTPLSEILAGEPIKRMLELQQNDGDVVCRSCSIAVPA